MEEELMDVKEVAKYLKLDEQTIYRKVDAKTIPFIKVGGVIRFRKESIEKWLNKTTVDKGGG